MTPTSVREAIEINGWRQGSVISYTTVKEYCDGHTSLPYKLICTPRPNIKRPASAKMVVINMSCDTVYGYSDQLPHVKFLLCWQKNEQISNSEIQDPRQMILTMSDESLTFRMKDRAFVPREVLCALQPDGQLSSDQVNSLIRWKVAQFNRLGLPEALVQRVGSALNSSDLHKWLQQNSAKLEGLFLEISPMTEIENDQKYDFGAVVVANSSIATSEEVFDMGMSIDEKLLKPLREIDGINLLNDNEYVDQDIAPAISSDDFSYDLLKRFRRYYLDHYSLDPESNTAPIST